MSHALKNLTPLQLKAKTISAIALVIMVLGGVGLDQVSKIHAQNKLMVFSDAQDPEQYRGIVNPVFTIGEPELAHPSNYTFYFGTNYVRNRGAAWGFLADVGDDLRVPFFYSVTAVAVLIIIVFMRMTLPGYRLQRFALPLILCGAIGNFIDRIRLGYVIDWIDVRWNLAICREAVEGSGLEFLRWIPCRYNFPNFNVADSAITVGVMCLLAEMFLLEFLRRRKTNSVPEE